MSNWHPRRDDAGKRVRIFKPTVPTPSATWTDPAAVAVFVPDGAVPPMLCSTAVAPWSPPEGAGAWETLAAERPFDQPLFAPLVGLQAAAGVVLIEPDGRCWLAQPSNGFGGVAHVLPKGRRDHGSTLAATALREVWEELGLLAELTGHLIDVTRSTTFVRYYVGRRIGGSVADMGWESQAAVLCPGVHLPELLDGLHDGQLVVALLRHLHSRY